MVYERYLEFLRNPDMKNYEVETTDVGINLIQAAFMVHDKVIYFIKCGEKNQNRNNYNNFYNFQIQFDVKIPDNLMYFHQASVTVVDPEKVRRLFE